MWKEKVKEQWLAKGDANTHFFHVTAVNHLRYNYISHIFAETRGKVSNQDAIG